ncbi:MAG: cupin domain-containing protein [Candidatus Marinimicrobia bacterium]|nr:cupin domain-containing protein [Candidatus Neomarinimicrobiota bacterium]
MTVPANLIHADDLGWKDQEHNGKVRFRRRMLAKAAGGDKIGCSQYDIPPGGKLWPYHYHYGNEEAIYVLSGAGKVRLPDGEYPLVPGDYVALPPGPSSAHRVTADDDTGVVVLIFSTMISPEVAIYPDSQKIGIFAKGIAGEEGDRGVRQIVTRDSGVDYWQDED